MLRKRLQLERGWVWMIIAVAIALMMTGAVALVANGTLPDPLGQHMRGYTVTGMLLGFLVVVLGTLTFAYSLRKRSLQEMAGGGTMMMWLWLHVVIGVLTLFLAFLHAGLGTISFPMSSGKILLWVFVGLTLSGIVWRIFYRAVPPQVVKRIGNYSREGAVARATELTTEIDALSAGRTDAFRQLRDWVCASPRTEMEIAHAVAPLSAEERDALERIHRLSASRRRALERYKLSPRYTRWLQVWRVIHVPLALSVIPLTCIHIVGATRLVTRLSPIGSLSEGMSGFVPSSECRDCHRRIYDQWKYSMHAHGMLSPVMIAQSNQVLDDELDDVDSPDPKLICVNCHGPAGIALTKQEQAQLPLKRDGYSKELLNDGIGCTVCHQLDLAEDPKRGEAGLVAFQKSLHKVGDVYFGNFDDPVGNAYHRSAKGRIFDNPERLCVACHNVVYDKNDDGRIEKGVDLVLQETTKEYDDYRKDGGQSTCIDCHMPIDKGTKRAANSAVLYFEQDSEAPDREVHDHSFVAVDYPLDLVSEKDPQRDKRRKLLRSAVKMDAVIQGDKLVVTITNTGTGHNVPTGLAFARQMWLEVKATDALGNLLYSSGVLAKNTDDLCDSSTMDEEGSKVARFVKGCVRSDADLVNYQLKLLDRIDVARDGSGNKVRDEDGEFKVIAADGARESVLQRINGGAVVRIRPVDKQPLVPIEPKEIRTHNYTLPAGVVRVSVRLLFRSFPPYFLRALAAGQPKNEKPRLAPLIENLLVEEMADQTLKL